MGESKPDTPQQILLFSTNINNAVLVYPDSCGSVLPTFAFISDGAVKFRFTYPTVDMVTKAHQNPSNAPR